MKMMCGCKCHVWKKLFVGALILVNAFLWPRWIGFESQYGWISFFAGLMVLGGLIHLIWPCNCCAVPDVKKKR